MRYLRHKSEESSGRERGQSATRPQSFTAREPNLAISNPQAVRAEKVIELIMLDQRGQFLGAAVVC